MGGGVAQRRRPTLLTPHRREPWTLFAMALWAMASASPVKAAEWVGAWGASEVYPSGPSISYQTIRQSMRLSLGGRALRIRISNELGAGRLDIGALHVARPGPEPGPIDPASDLVVTFGGRRTVSIQPGMPMLSDPIPMTTAALDTLVISMFVPRTTGPTATHPSGSATTYIVDGDETSAPKLAAALAFGSTAFGSTSTTTVLKRSWHSAIRSPMAPFRPMMPTGVGPTCWPSALHNSPDPLPLSMRVSAGIAYSTTYRKPTMDHPHSRVSIVMHWQSRRWARSF